ncbi:MAG: hypothetical protein R3D63_13460 [Paracoccaceae bacterium]
MTDKPFESSRPAIWAEGSQHPPFQPRACALASVSYAREILAGVLARCGQSADGFGQRVATGAWRVPQHRLGRSGRLLPSVERTGATIQGAAEVLRQASDVALPGDRPAPAVSIFTPAPPAAAKVVPLTSAAPARRPVAPDDPELAAIRAMIGEGTPAPRALAQAEPAATPEQAPAAQDATRGWRGEVLVSGLARVLGYGLLVVLVPAGMVRAVIAHLNGEDLRQMVSED